MRKYSHDVVLRLRIPHRPGQLAAIAAAIAEHGALLGDIATLSAGEHDTVRDLTAKRQSSRGPGAELGARPGVNPEATFRKARIRGPRAFHATATSPALAGLLTG